MNNLFDNLLNDDIKNKIYSMITYPQSHELLIQIKLYQNKKKYIDLFYKYIINYWTYCYIDALSIIWKIYHLCIIEKIDVIFKNDFHLNYFLGNYEKFISNNDEEIYTAELIRILNNSDKNIKNLLIKKYITKYIMVLKIHQLEFIDKELSIWGDITKYGYNDESLNDFSHEIINKSYLLPAPVILNEYINFYID
jgi:hypothetical protein